MPRLEIRQYSDDIMEMILRAELLAKSKHAGMLRSDKITPFIKHLEDVVSRLKGLGVTDDELLSAGWLHDIIEYTDTDFDDIYEQFGNRVAVIVSTLSKDMSLPRKRREQSYIAQLRDSSYDVKLVKLCDISANLGDLKKWNTNRSKKIRQMRQKRRYASIIIDDLISDTRYPKTIKLLESINQTLRQFGQRSIFT